jgi:hypothetical protein
MEPADDNVFSTTFWETVRRNAPTTPIVSPTTNNAQFSRLFIIGVLYYGADIARRRFSSGKKHAAVLLFFGLKIAELCGVFALPPSLQRS